MNKKLKRISILVIVLIFLVSFACFLFIEIANQLENDFYSHAYKEANERGLFSWVRNSILKLIILVVAIALELVFYLFLNYLTILFYLSLTALQNVIYILTVYPFLENLFKFNVIKFVSWTSFVFILLLIFFIFLKYISNLFEEESKPIWIGFSKAILFFLLFPIMMFLLLACSQLFIEWVWGINNIYEISIAKLLLEATINNNSFGNESGFIINIIAYSFKSILYIIASIFTIYYLWWFSITLVIRLYEFVIMLFIGVIISSSSRVYDEGERFVIWNSIMIQKIWIPILLLAGFIIYLSTLDVVLDFINNINDEVFVLGFSEITKMILQLIVIISGGVLLKSLSTEWSFILTGGKSGSFATQINDVMGDVSRPFNLFSDNAKRASGYISNPFAQATSDLEKGISNPLGLTNIENNSSIENDFSLEDLTSRHQNISSKLEYKFSDRSLHKEESLSEE